MKHALLLGVALWAATRCGAGELPDPPSASPATPPPVVLGLPSQLEFPVPPSFPAGTGFLPRRTDGSAGAADPLEIHQVQRRKDRVVLEFTAWEAGTYDLSRFLQVDPADAQVSLPKWEVRVTDLAGPDDELKQSLPFPTLEPPGPSWFLIGTAATAWLAVGAALYLLDRWIRFRRQPALPLPAFPEGTVHTLIARAREGNLTAAEAVQIHAILIAWLRRKHQLSSRRQADALRELRRLPEACVVLDAWDEWSEAVAGSEPPAVVQRELQAAQTASQEATP